MGRGIGPTAQNMAKGSLLSIPFSAISARFHYSFSPAPEPYQPTVKAARKRPLRRREVLTMISYGTKGGENYNPEKARVNFLEITTVANNSN